jgi:hypothetical protein
VNHGEGLLAAGIVDIGDHHASALARKLYGGRPPDSCGCSGDKCDFSLETFVGHLDTYLVDWKYEN